MPTLCYHLAMTLLTVVFLFGLTASLISATVVSPIIPWLVGVIVRICGGNPDSGMTAGIAVNVALAVAWTVAAVVLGHVGHDAGAIVLIATASYCLGGAILAQRIRQRRRRAL